MIEKLERGLLERALGQLPDDYLRQLYRLSVYRKPFKRQAIERLFDDIAVYAIFKNEIIDRFIMEQHKGWFNLHPIAREIGLQKLAQSRSDLKQAHSIVATYYTRHFEAKLIVGWGALGGHFVEARYHLVKAGKEDDLKEIASRFQSYIFSTLSAASPVPSSPEELDERIAVLSALLETPGPRYLEYYLARLFKVRNQRNDLRRALHHIRRAISNSDFAPSWQLCSEILSQMGRNEEAIDVLKDGIARVPVNMSVFSLYQAAGELLAQTGKTDEAIVLLKDGIAKLSIGKYGRHRLVEPVLSMMLAKQSIQTLDNFLSGTGALTIEPPQLALGKIYRLMILREWEAAAQLARQEKTRFPLYRPIMQAEAFCWLCINNLSAAEEALQPIIVQDKPFEPTHWFRTWVALKQHDRSTARDSLSFYLNRPISEQELSEQFLLELWDTAPTGRNRVDLAYYYPILPASLTGLPNDVVRIQYGPSVIIPLSSHQEQTQSAPMILPPNPLPVSIESESPDWPAWMDEAVNPLGNKPRLDVGIVIALEEEFRELAPQIKRKPYYNPDIKQYYYLFERSNANASLAPYRCVVTFMGTMGPTDAVVVADRLIAQFNPETIVSIGIAGSMDQAILVGDIVVADQTDEYLATSKAIETTDKNDWDIQFSGNPYKSDPAYVAHAANLRYAHVEVAQGWESMSKRKLLEWIGTISTEDLIRQHLIGDVPRIHTGHIASGHIVGAANQFVQWLKERRDRKFLALEMESVGVLNAAHKRAVSSLIIRGISDYSDERKKTLDELGRGALRRYAMNNALALLWVLMDLRLINKAE